MAQVINTNVMSLNAQRNLSTSGGQLATALQRLSSGLRINSAKDDAAGLAIAERFTTQIRGLNQAARNANDGISLAQTGEGALAEITNNLQRIRELAVQAANSTNSASDRAALDQEVQQRLAEIQRIASQTSFNGQKILDGTFGTAAFQVGANAGETISIGLSTSMKTTDVGQIASTTSANVSALFGGTGGLVLGNGDLTVNGNNVAAATYASADDLADAINTAAGSNIASVVGGEIQITNSDTGNAINFGGANNPLGITTVNAATPGAVTPGDEASLSITTSTFDGFDTNNGGTNVTFAVELDASGSPISVTLDQDYGDGNTMAADIQTQLRTASSDNNWNVSYAGGAIVIEYGDTSVVHNIALTTEDGDFVSANASATAGTVDSTGPDTPTVVTTSGVADLFAAATGSLTLDEGELTIQVGNGEAVDLEGEYENGAALAAAINASVAGAFASFDEQANTLSLSSGETITLGGTRFADFGFAANEVEATSGSLADASVESVAAANSTILRVDAALTSVNTLRGTLGAIQNRFESTITNLTTAAENLTASRSRIQDADFAAETALLTRAQILQQAGTAILAQANAVPQNVLSLLR